MTSLMLIETVIIEFQLVNISQYLYFDANFFSKFVSIFDDNIIETIRVGIIYNIIETIRVGIIKFFFFFLVNETRQKREVLLTHTTNQSDIIYKLYLS